MWTLREAGKARAGAKAAGRVCRERSWKSFGVHGAWVLGKVWQDASPFGCACPLRFPNRMQQTRLKKMSEQDVGPRQAVLAAMRQRPIPPIKACRGQPLHELALQEGQNLLAGYLQKWTSEIFSSLPLRCPQAQQTLDDLGFDSMRAMELRHRIETELEVSLSPSEFIGTCTFAHLVRLMLDQLLLTSITRSEDLSSGFNDGSEEITL